MKRAIARFVFGTSTLALATCWVGAAVAQSGEPATGAGRATLPTSALTLLKTKMSDKSSSLTLTLSAADAFPELSINCPNSEDSCTLRIEVSSQFTSIDLGTAAQMIVLVDGSGAGVRPSSQLNVNAVATGAFGTVSTMTFAKNVGPGSHTVKVQFKVTGGMASAGLRMLTVSIFKP